MIRRLRAHRATGEAILTGIASQSVLVVSGVLVARLLGVENRGQLALLAVIPSILAIIGGMGMPLGTTYAIAKEPDSARRVIRALRGPAVAQSLGLLVLHAAILAWVMRHESDSVRLAGLFSLLFVPSFLAQQYGLAVLQGLRVFGLFNRMRMLPVVAYAAALVGFVLFGVSSLPAVTLAWAGTNAIVGAIILATAIRLTGAYDRRRNGDPAPIGPIFRFGASGLLGSASPVENFRIDQAVVGLFLTPAALGLYVVALAFTNLPRFIGQNVGMVAYPDVAAQPDPALARRALVRFVALGAAVSLAVFVGLQVSLAWLVPLFFGEAFRGAVDLARILLISSFLLGIRRMLADGARGLGAPAADTIAEAASWLVLLPALALLTPRFGSNGVALAMTLSSFASLLVILRLVISKWVDRTSTEPRFEEGGHDSAMLTRGLSSLRRSPRHNVGLWVILTLVSTTLLGAATGAAGEGAAELALLTVVGAVAVWFVLARWGTHGLALASLVLAAGLLTMNRIRLTEWATAGDLFLFFAVLVLLPAALVERTLTDLNRIRPLLIGAALIVAGGALGSFYAVNPAVSLANLCRLLSAVVVSTIAVYLLRPSSREVRAIAIAYVSFAAVSAFAGVALNESVQGRALGLAVHPNHFAVASVLATGIAIGLAASSRGWLRWSMIVAIVLLVAAVLESGSRSGVVGLAVESIVLTWFLFRRVIPIIGIGLIGVVLGLAVFGLPSTLNDTALDRLIGGEDDSIARSNEDRRILLSNALAVAREYPLTGVGFEEGLEAHNIYLQVFVSAGVLGLLGFIVIVLTVWYYGLKSGNHRARALSSTRQLMLGLCAGFAGYLAMGMFQNSLWDRYIWIIPALIMACEGLDAGRKNAPSIERSPRRSAAALAPARA